MHFRALCTGAGAGAGARCTPKLNLEEPDKNRPVQYNELSNIMHDYINHVVSQGATPQTSKAAPAVLTTSVETAGR